MSNIVKVQSNLARNEKEKVRFPIRLEDTAEHLWSELRFTEDEQESWIDVGVIYPYIADQFRLSRMQPSDFAAGSWLRSLWDAEKYVDSKMKHCLEQFVEQQVKKVNPNFYVGHLG